MPQVRAVFRTLQKQTKRRPYVRSAYFGREKVFFDYFWHHMNRKLPSERSRRLRYFPCALELLRHSRHDPQTFIDSKQPGVIKHLFRGTIVAGSRFLVVVQQDRKTGRKQLISLYPLRPGR